MNTTQKEKFKQERLKILDKLIKLNFDGLCGEAYGVGVTELKVGAVCVPFLSETIDLCFAQMEKEILASKYLTDNYWLAKLFHNEYEGLAEKYGWKTNKATRVPFDDLPSENRNLMLAICKLIMWTLRKGIKQSLSGKENHEEK